MKTSKLFTFLQKSRLILALLSFATIIIGTIAIIQYAKGYRPNLKEKNIQGTGLLVANSFPEGAQVFINNKLTTATDDTLNLTPGEYQVEIRKDGFTSWTKRLKLESELVTQTDATLFSSVPTLKPLSFSGAHNPTPSPDGQKIAFLVDNAANPAQNGLWLLDISGPNFNIIRHREPRQISPQLAPIANTHLTFSPDNSLILLHAPEANYLLEANRFNNPDNLKDVTARLPIIFSEWETTLFRKQLEQILTLPTQMQNILIHYTSSFYFSPDEEKLLFKASKPITIPDTLIPDLPSESTQLETRRLEPNTLYVYDLKEDKNFKVGFPPPAELGNQPQQKTLLIDSNDLTSSLPVSGVATDSASLRLHNILQTTDNIASTIQNFNAQYSPLPVQHIQWFPTSSHLVQAENNQISILEYDGTNKVVIYNNQSSNDFVYPWPNGSQLIILTNLTQSNAGQTSPNLYSINLK